MLTKQNKIKTGLDHKKNYGHNNSEFQDLIGKMEN